MGVLEVTRDCGQLVAVVTCVLLALWLLEQLLVTLQVFAAGLTPLVMTVSGAFHNTRSMQGLVLKCHHGYIRDRRGDCISLSEELRLGAISISPNAAFQAGLRKFKTTHQTPRIRKKGQQKKRKKKKELCLLLEL